jgi:hypothetical protein
VTARKFLNSKILLFANDLQRMQQVVDIADLHKIVVCSLKFENNKYNFNTLVAEKRKRKNFFLID